MSSALQSLRARAARRRSGLFRQFIAPLPRPLRILDLGGSHEMWRRWGVGARDGLEIVLLNNHGSDVSHARDARYAPFVTEHIGDVRALAAVDLQRYDLVFSNSMFEHLYTREMQQRVARVVIDSGRPYFIQVPNRRCLVDPHFPHPLAPFFAVWPRALQARALSVHGLGSGAPAGSIGAARQRLSHYVPIDRRALQALFPQARIVTEWSLGLPMSLVALHADERPAAALAS